jgi:hypothetical protein
MGLSENGVHPKKLTFCEENGNEGRKNLICMVLYFLDKTSRSIPKMSWRSRRSLSCFTTASADPHGYLCEWTQDSELCFMLS